MVRLTAGLYSLLLIPTLVTAVTAMSSGTPFSRLVETAWRIPMWDQTFLNVLPDVGMIAIVLLAGIIYGQQTCAAQSKNWTGTVSLRTVLGWTALLAAPLVAVIPFHSRDLYGYINRGAQQALYGVNPYVFTVEDLPTWHDDLMFHEHWIHNPCPYGFGFALLAKALVWASANHFWLAFLLFKLVNALTLLGTTALVYTVSQQMNRSRPWVDAFLIGANPLILLHTVANGHNDLQVGLLLLSAIALAISHRGRWAALPVLTGSILLKLVPVVTVPALAVYLVRKKAFLALGLGLVVSGLLTAVLALPYVGDWQQFPWDRITDNAGLTQHSLHSLLSRVVFYSAKIVPALEPWVEPARTAFKMLLLGGFGAGLLVLLSRFAVRPIADKQAFNDRLVTTMAASMLGLLLVGSSKFNVWYLAMVLPVLAVCRPNHWLYRVGVWLSLIQLLAFTPVENIHILGVAVLTILPAVLAWRTPWLGRDFPETIRSVLPRTPWGTRRADLSSAALSQASGGPHASGYRIQSVPTLRD
jgi:hypothetical protein